MHKLSVIHILFSFILVTSCRQTSLNSLHSPIGFRIVNGDDIDIREIPYYASLQHLTESGWDHICGSVIIGQKLLLTAAHCITGTQIRVVVGSSYRLSGGTAFNIKKTTVHENYNPSRMENDIAMLQTYNSMISRMTAFVRAVALPADGQLEDGTEALVSGFGFTRSGGSRPLMLKAARVQVVNQNACISAYEGYADITAGMLCAGAVDPMRDACKGDSGGPLVADNILIGIVSWGYECADPSHPGVYTRVSSYIPWIYSKL